MFSNTWAVCLFLSGNLPALSFLCILSKIYGSSSLNIIILVMCLWHLHFSRVAVKKELPHLLNIVILVMLHANLKLSCCLSVSL